MDEPTARLIGQLHALGVELRACEESREGYAVRLAVPRLRVEAEGEADDHFRALLAAVWRLPYRVRWRIGQLVLACAVERRRVRKLAAEPPPGVEL